MKQSDTDWGRQLLTSVTRKALAELSGSRQPRENMKGQKRGQIRANKHEVPKEGMSSSFLGTGNSPVRHDRKRPGARVLESQRQPCPDPAGHCGPE